MKPPRNITRLDHHAKRDHAWIVTLCRKWKIVVKRFSDGVYGGKKEALKAAVEYRDSILAKDKPFDHQIWIRTRLRKNNKSGIPGVHRYEVVGNPDTGNVREYWVAAWTDEYGATRQRKFSVTRYGEKEAKRLAMAEREYQLERVCNINVARRVAEPPDQKGIWEEFRTEGARDHRGRVNLRPEDFRSPSRPFGGAGLKRGGNEKVRVVEATIDPDGTVKVLEQVKLTSTRRALVTIFAEGRGRSRAKR